MGTDNFLFQNILKVIQGYLKYFGLTPQVTCISIFWAYPSGNMCIYIIVCGCVGPRKKIAFVRGSDAPKPRSTEGVFVCLSAYFLGDGSPKLLKFGGWVMFIR